MIAYAIVASKLTKNIDRTIVSTDSGQIAEIAKKYGAEVPFLRPSEISLDKSTDLEFVQHAIGWFKENEKSVPELLIHLRATTPLRDPVEIEKAIELFKGKPESTALRSVHELAESPQKVFQIDRNGFLRGFFPDDPRPEYYNLPRQVFPKAYQPNGYVDILKTDYIIKSGKLHGTNMLSFITKVAVEVDLLSDFELLEYQLQKYSGSVCEYLKNNFKKEA